MIQILIQDQGNFYSENNPNALHHIQKIFFRIKLYIEDKETSYSSETDNKKSILTGSSKEWYGSPIITK